MKNSDWLSNQRKDFDWLTEILEDFQLVRNHCKNFDW